MLGEGSVGKVGSGMYWMSQIFEDFSRRLKFLGAGGSVGAGEASGGGYEEGGGGGGESGALLSA